MNKPYILFLEGSIGVGKSSVCKMLREVLPCVTLLDLTGCPDKSDKGKNKTYRYHGKILQLMEETSNLDMNYVVGRSYMSESVYTDRLNLKPYSFERESYCLKRELEYLTNFYDIYFIQLVATKEQLEERLKRDKFEYVKHSVDNALMQQEAYRDEMRLLAKECQSVKVLEIPNDDLQKTVDTIKDLVLTNMIGD